jgi:hypothetical protein
MHSLSPSWHLHCPLPSLYHSNRAAQVYRILSEAVYVHFQKLCVRSIRNQHACMHTYKYTFTDIDFSILGIRFFQEKNEGKMGFNTHITDRQTSKSLLGVCHSIFSCSLTGNHSFRKHCLVRIYKYVWVMPSVQIHTHLYTCVYARTCVHIHTYSHVSMPMTMQLRKDT